MIGIIRDMRYRAKGNLNKGVLELLMMNQGGNKMSRSEILREGRERIIKELSGEHENKAKLLTALMDIDDEMEQIRRDEKNN